MRLGGMRVVSGLMAACQQQQQKQQQQHRQLRQPTAASDHQPNSFRLLTASEQQASCSTARERENERRCCRVAGSWSRPCTMPNTRAERTQAHTSTQYSIQKQKQRPETDTAAAGSWHQPIGALRWAAGRRVRICHFQINSTPTTTITTASDDDGKKAAAVGSLQNRSTTPQLHSVINERYSQLQQQQQQPQQQKQQQQPQQKSLHSMHTHKHIHTHAYTLSVEQSG
ncbi:transcription activator MSS11-like [Drosophila mojavensis]|uniref:transcription activator MSS11-like n=1 Tax=Drosophila mojavensis TaxID=7230 RepID=UPI001CD11EE6|nr:transcription activator MSS11-like [Drosophila mojavensis]